ncbi:Aldo/keto reductase [Sistotremastrum suecicum HHB10207 ss-3]|uniref:Aldo/keto reductase n=1 Tax=Sistotremastrum suecicum HHB10207 ss-3 TaxID=1314776 RepID=A0A166FXZ9_9AGAM|nr:Aldo/keto reductase [Sistotremastrum suecicum HHB10207 ss-3]
MHSHVQLAELDEDSDRPSVLIPIRPQEVGALKLTQLVFGAATFSHFYNTPSVLSTDIPLRTVQLALRYGIKAFDTSPYYGDSEKILGDILEQLRTQFPRKSYKLLTKCGRITADHFDYTPQAIRASVIRSLRNLKTSYLDVVYLHDVEFVATPVWPKPNTGDHTYALHTAQRQWGLRPGEEARIWGPGDQCILDAIGELQKLKKQGIVKAIGISGYPLPTLLRLALLVLHHSPCEPLDVVMSYSNYTLQNATFIDFHESFTKQAKVAQLITASPFSMGLLTDSPPDWHPAPTDMRRATAQAAHLCKPYGGIADVALGFALHREPNSTLTQVPTVIGLSNLKEVHTAMRILNELANGHSTEREQLESQVQAIYAKGRLLGKTWIAGPAA